MIGDFWIKSLIFNPPIIMCTCCFSHIIQNVIVQVFEENANGDTVIANKAELFIRVPAP